MFFLYANFTVCKNNGNKNHINSAKVLETSLNYILNHQRLVKEYHNQPLQIINYKSNPFQEQIVVRGTRAIILPDTTNSYLLMKNMDIFKPIPIVEIITIKNEGENIVSVDLIFRSTGHSFFLRLKETKNEEFSVISISEQTI
ncbi:hypothetical protein [Pedobacter insulae]|uniref:Uncharacterized protein n=1 Tax=Pedobacter insulae TaxID=414048 RepID=A0A1I2T7K7_9SPHI|nr:hypothetical protein [Pedobacter insulae]SFG60953.1 hypothetical protein SAMN04489864_101243 [Pedobacter insulae]